MSCFFIVYAKPQSFSNNLTFIRANMGFFYPPLNYSISYNKQKVVNFYFFSLKASKYGYHYHRLKIIVPLLQ
jgi:hypothetical protein